MGFMPLAHGLCIRKVNMSQNSRRNIPGLVNHFEAGIRSGKISQVWSELKEIRPSEIPREFLIPFADFGRRVQQPLYTLKVLGKLIRAHREQTETASTEEIMAYVGALIKMGFFDEAHRWLEGISVDRFPQLLDLKARIQIARWNYRSSAFYLKRYLRTLEKGSYSWQVGCLNYSASLISSGRAAEAVAVLRRLRGEARRQSSRLILGNAWELQAQADMELEQLEKARKALNNSLKLLGRTQSIWAFYIRKWNHLFDLKQVSDFSLVSDQHRQLRSEALNNSYWEDLRELERARGLATGSRDQLLKVYFGTPYEHYRSRLLHISPPDLNVPEEFLFPIGVGDGGGEWDRHRYLDVTSVTGRMFELLTHDMYRPLSLGYAFSTLYPGEYFDPFHSPGRVASVVQRLRGQLEKSAVEVWWSSSGIRLNFQKPGLLRLQKSQNLVDPEKQKLVEIREAFGKKWFQRQDLECECQVSARTANRLLKDAAKAYSVEVSGAGRARRYRFR